MKQGSNTKSDSAKSEAGEAPPSSESELRLSAWFKSTARQGALPEERANADTAFAVGHSRGLEEGRQEHLDATRTLLLRILESKGGEVDEATFDRIGCASLKDLEAWILSAAID